MPFNTNQQLKWFADGLLKNIVLDSEKAEKEYPLLTPHIITSRQAYEDITTSSTLGLAQAINEGDSVTYDLIQAVNEKRYTPVIYALGFKTSNRALEMDQYNVVRPATRQDIVRSVLDRMDLEAANVFNNAFSGSGVLIPDGKTLVATDHPLQSGTYSNRGNASNVDVTLSALALREQIALMGRQVNHRGIWRPVKGQFEVIVPVELEPEAWTIVNSTGLAGTADNDANYNRGKVSRVISSAAIGFADSGMRDAWFVRASDKSQHKMFMLIRKGYSLDTDKDIDTISTKFVVHAEFCAGAFDFRGLRGSNP